MIEPVAARAAACRRTLRRRADRHPPGYRRRRGRAPGRRGRRRPPFHRFWGRRSRESL